MNDAIREAIKELAKRAAGTTVEPHHAMNLAQAALNLAHTLQVCAELKEIPE